LGYRGIHLIEGIIPPKHVKMSLYRGGIRGREGVVYHYPVRGGPNTPLLTIKHIYLLPLVITYITNPCKTNHIYNTCE